MLDDGAEYRFLHNQAKGKSKNRKSEKIINIDIEENMVARMSLIFMDAKTLQAMENVP